jgi:uncharacterized membrane protein (DUF4010 family)
VNLDLTVATQIAYAVGIGMLLGLERSFGTLVERGEVGATAQPPASEEAAPTLEDVEIGDSSGMRTFSVLSLLGYSAALLGETWPWSVPVTLIATAALVVAMYMRTTDHGLGITTEAATICAPALGMLCRVNYDIAAVLGLLLTVILASKRTMHGMVRKVRRVELTDTLKFLVVILIVLPLLPNRALDPYDAFNPYKVGVLVVLISGISFAGYFLTRFLGAQKGLGLTGVIGGLTSSTAVTAAMAQQAKENPSLRAICAFSTVAANATMFARVLVVVALLHRPLFFRLLWSVGGMAVAAAAATVALWFAAGKEQKSAGDEGRKEVPLKNPFSVGPALKFAAFFVFILFLLKLAKLYLGDSGLYIASAVSGLADVDAITLSVSEQVSNEEMVGKVGAIAITIAVVSNSVTKTGIAISTGGWQFGKLVALSLGAATVVGLVAAVVV